MEGVAASHCEHLRPLRSSKDRGVWHRRARARSGKSSAAVCTAAAAAAAGRLQQQLNTAHLEASHGDYIL